MGRQPIMRLFFLFLTLTPTLIHSWSLFGFGDSKADQLSLHPLSPAEADPKTLRVKRQAYQVNIDGDVTVTVDQAGSGSIETGVWGPWHRETDCSRPCGGGVYKEKRECNGECTGASVRYHSCNLDECPEDSTDFRAEQCAAHNDDPLDGKYYKWIPYAGANKCELTCKPDSADFYYKWADKVVDGTKCDKLSNDICVDGVCLPLGCDGKLGSTAKADKCGVCNGNGTTCKSQEGVIKESALSSGYNNVIVLPVGATSIKIEENRPTSNSLAIKNATGDYFLNGNHQIVLNNQDVIVGGTVFKYQKAKADSSLSERLTAAGPLKEELTIQLLFQRAPHGSAVKYSFSTPLEDDVQFIYKPGEWSQCSVECGKGVQTRSAFCTDTSSNQRVGDEVCDENNSTKPVLEKACLTVDCDAEWFTGNWEDCSETCGNHGLQYRVVYCHKVFANGKRMTVDDENCTSVERPPVKQTCNRFTCPEWNAGPWSACSEKCGDAKQYRSVTCRSQKEGEEAKLLPASDCPSDVELETERHCNLGPCEGLNFKTTDWNLCERCNDTTETRNVTCHDETGRPYPLEKCLNDEVTEIPADTRPCATQPPCTYEWHVSEWSKCSTECGHGHKTRKVHCAINELGSIKILDESLCTGEKPESKEECTNEEKCTGTYYSGPWSNCTAECGGGTQTRLIACLNYDKKPVPEWCDEKERPAEEQECNVDPCPTCFDSEFGCCPDNSTFATDDWFGGCSNCSLTEFGCCNDNITAAAGPDNYGCDEYIETTPGSGEEPTEATVEEIKQKDDEECEVSNEETGEIVKLLCSDVNKTGDLADDLLLGFGNETEAENQTIHCSKTEFGCCQDWYTPAEGKNFQGCPQFVLGKCNETTYGCCEDGVTLARGPNNEGCGDPVCAASLFGCCKDQKTIAFGPHYGGCERTTQTCEFSTYGCCEDGKTEALDKEHSNCQSNCLLTKYGCCIDGKTAAKGPNGEGCGCQSSQFGCCSDGKTPAKGPNSQGCPQSCANTRWGCCPNGKEAQGPNFEGCAPTTPAPTTTTTPSVILVGGTASPSRIVSCNLPQDKGDVGPRGYQLAWFYDTNEGRCSQFWYGGAGGNDNRFTTQEECETVCVEPPEIGRCYLPKNEGPQRCTNLVARYWYDYTTKQCAAFWHRGCLGNANNFESWEACMGFCKGVGPFENNEPATIVTIPPYVVEQRRPEQQYQPQDPVQVYPADQKDDEKRLNAQRQYEEDLRVREQQRKADEQKRLDEYNQRQKLYEAQRLADQQRFAEQQRQQQEADRLRNQQKQRPPQAAQNLSATNDWNTICRLSVDSGTCNDYQDAFYFDHFTGQCYGFIYTGCGGNKNRFESRSQCEQRCGHLVSDNQLLGQQQLNAPRLPKATLSPNVATSKSPNACNAPKDVGRCTGHFNRYYYDRDLGNCEVFQYSGCGGNENRFNSREECAAVCLRTVSQPQVPSAPQDFGQSVAPVNGYDERCEGPKEHGPCSNFALKWYYNKEDGVCSKFYWGGCGGNKNLHSTEQDCKDVCANYVDACTLPVVKGPCEGNRKRWYFDKTRRECHEFVFGGCLGNENNFPNKETCEQRCQSSR